MDYLDQKKEARQRITLLLGYALVGLAIVIATIILLYQSNGFGVNKKGDVIQNGLTFFSSHPNPADIYVNGQLRNVKTNTRLVLPSGVYDIKLTRSGYYDWQREIEVKGGDVQHYDYPFLFPKTLTTTKTQSFSNVPSLMTQSPDHRWVIIQASSNLQEFSLYDLKSPTKVATAFSIPANVLSKSGSSDSLRLVEWADDNRHLVLRHNYDDKFEFILVDRDSPEQSLNLNKTLGQNPAELTLNDRKYDQYYIFDSNTGVLQKSSLKTPAPAAVQNHVLAYKSYGDNTILYISNQGAPAGKVSAIISVGGKSYKIRNLSAGTNYVVDLTKYSGVMYVVVGATSDNRAYIYKDPAGQREAQPDQAPVSAQVLRVDQVNSVGFSPTAQYIVAQNGNRFGVYDIENKTGYNYITKQPMDSPQTRAIWMDGNRLTYVSNGKLLVFDFDYKNLQTLMNASSNYPVAFSPDYKFVDAISPTAAPTQFDLTQTSLLAPADR